MSYHHMKRELKQETVQDPHYEALKRKKEMELLLSQRPVLPNQYWNTNNIKQVNYTPTMGGAALKCEVKMEFSIGVDGNVQSSNGLDNNSRNNQENHQCQFCQKSFSRPFSLKTHLKSVHDGLKDHKCTLCGKYFSRLFNLKTHIKNIHEKPPEDILDSIPKDIATMPPTMESYRQELNRQQLHQQQHQGLHHHHLQHNPQKQANLSNVNQNRETGLVKDLRIPTGSAEILKNWPTKGHKCNICHKMFSRPFVLKTHIRSVHYGLKDHRCTFCGKTFSRLFNLKTHHRTIHEGLKNYQCDNCSKSFACSSHLNNHIKSVHEQTKKHKCVQCGKGFTRLFSLTTHTRNVHEGQKNHKCNYCDKSFCRAHDVKKHMISAHNINT